MATYVGILTSDEGPRIYRIHEGVATCIFPSVHLRRRRFEGRYWGEGAIGATYVASHLLGSLLSHEDDPVGVLGRFTRGVVRSLPIAFWHLDDDFLSRWLDSDRRAFRR